MARSRRQQRASVKDPTTYEALRDQGASKEKAARIANASADEGRQRIGHKGGKEPAYDEWTVAELRERAAEIGISGRSSMRKAELVRALRNH